MFHNFPDIFFIRNFHLIFANLEGLMIARKWPQKTLKKMVSYLKSNFIKFNNLIQLVHMYLVHTERRYSYCLKYITLIPSCVAVDKRSPSD